MVQNAYIYVKTLKTGRPSHHKDIMVEFVSKKVQNAYTYI